MRKTSFLIFLFAIRSLLSFGHRVIRGVLKPLGKSVEIKKKNKTKNEETKIFLLPIPPNPCFPHSKSACACRPFITLAHLSYWQSGNFFMVRVISGVCWAARCCNHDQDLARYLIRWSELCWISTVLCPWRCQGNLNSSSVPKGGT